MQRQQAARPYCQRYGSTLQQGLIGGLCQDRRRVFITYDSDLGRGGSGYCLSLIRIDHEPLKVDERRVRYAIDVMIQCAIGNNPSLRLTNGSLPQPDAGKNAVLPPRRLTRTE